MVFLVVFAVCAGLAFGQDVLVLAPMQNDGEIEDGQIRTLTRLLENALQRTRRFDLIDRGAVEDILKEHGFQLSDLADARKTVEVGKLLNANYLVRPSVMPLAGDLFLESRIVDVNTAKMLNSAEVRIKFDLSDAYEKLGDFAATLAGAAMEYKIGGRGPAGGWIFYDQGRVTNGWRYLEAAPAEAEFTAQWGADRKEMGGTATGVGTGKRNTELIVNFLKRTGETNRAAQLCDELLIDGYDDWFLPSKEDLDFMYKNLKAKGLGEFSDDWYWSSSEISFFISWGQSFNFPFGGSEGSVYKDNTAKVRAVRAF
jgi:TolB-like protein